jgi:hypothetical protein
MQEKGYQKKKAKKKKKKELLTPGQSRLSCIYIHG